MDPADRTHASRGTTWLIITALLWFFLRVGLVTSREGDLPFQSANDRSRWCTIRALVDHGTYQIDDVIRQPHWNTIDKVAHAGPDGQMHYYSSKPTLLSTLLAFPYWAIKQVTGWTLADHPMRVGRLIVAIVNGGFLLLLWLSLRGILLEHGPSAWGVLYTMSVATWGTYLTCFAITLNNHLPAAAACMVAIWAVLRVERSPHPIRYWSLAGAASAFAFCCELPALSLLAAAFAYSLWRSPKQAAVSFLPVAGLVLAASLATNWWAHDSLLPPYAHRTEGGDWSSGNWYVYPGSYWLPENRKGVDQGEPSRARYAWHVVLGHHGIFPLNPVWLLALLGIWRAGDVKALRWVIWLGALLTLVCLIFYILGRPLTDRNYGGVAVAFRWLLWLEPFWLLAILAASVRLSQSRHGRLAQGLLLTTAVASTSYAWFRPWKQPWIFELMQPKSV